MRSVIVSEETKPIHVFDEDFHKVQIGSVLSRIYQGENVVRHSFVTEDHESILGVTRGAFQNLDYGEIIEPLLDMGFIITKYYLIRKGVGLVAFLEPAEETRLLRDPISWDHDYWVQRYPSRKNISGLRELLQVVAFLKPGRGIKFNHGLYRLICTNGMMSRVLEFPSLRFSHTNFDPTALQEFGHGDTAGIISEKMKVYVGNRNGVQAYKNFMENVGSVGFPELPFYLKEEISPLGRMPAWYRESMLETMDLFLETRSNKDMGLFDLVNTLTNPISMNPEHDSSAGRIVLKMDSYVKASAVMIGAYSL